MNIYKDMPKILLHIHLDGSIRVATANELMGKDVGNLLSVQENLTSLEEYLTKFKIPIQLMQNAKTIERVSFELAEDLKNDNIIYAEIRFAPLLHTEKGMLAEEVVDSVIRGIMKVKDIKINLILCMMRHMSDSENIKVIELATKYKEVVAIDLAGDEANFKTKNFEKLFQIAKEKNVPFTIHSGEADGEESIRAAIRSGAKRLGHGVRCIENKELLEKIIEENITLEICPTSNVQTGVITDYKEHPVKKLYDAGALVTINTDNNTVSNIKLSQEYELLAETFGFDEKDFKQFNINAINASFMNEEEKKKCDFKIN